MANPLAQEAVMRGLAADEELFAACALEEALRHAGMALLTRERFLQLAAEAYDDARAQLEASRAEVPF
jgi:hypothetical protein